MSEIIVRIGNSKDLQSYQKGIFNLLSRVEISSNDESFKDDLKSVYQLLNLLLTERS